MYVLKVFDLIGRVFFWWIVRFCARSVRGRSSMSLYNFDEWNASFMAMIWVVIVNMVWVACMWGIVSALRLRIEQDLRESRWRGHESKGEKTSETWSERGFVEFVRVFIGRSHPLSFWLQHLFIDFSSQQNTHILTLWNHAHKEVLF